MLPKPNKQTELEANEAWVAEAKQLFNQVLGFNLTTRSKKWKPISEELWRFILFSEFVFDLPGDLPESLSTVPCASKSAMPVIENLCDSLRQDLRKQEAYIQYAEKIQRDLSLEKICGAITDLGVRDTFPFEERTFLHQAIKAFDANDIERINEILF